MIKPIIMCGGSGTRLWPLSRKSLPKQFVPLIGPQSLLEETINRSKNLSNEGEIWVVASEEHRFFIQEIAKKSNTKIKVFLEPVAKNTAAAMAIAGINADENELLLFLPSDHYIPDIKIFNKIILSAVSEARKGAFVVFGVTPSSPHCGYGYIQVEKREGPIKKVLKFHEKPNLDKAIEYLSNSDCYWNSGMFLCTSKTLVEGLRKHSPDILDCVQKSVSNQKIDGNFVHLDEESFIECRSQSIDYAVLEHHDNIVMIEYEGIWSDVGSWSSVAELSPQDEQGNNVFGQAFVYDSSSTLVYGPHRPVVAIGTKNLIIIDDKDALLVASQTHAEKVKDIVSDLKDKKIKEAEEHRLCLRPWGSYDVLEEGPNFKVKRITVKPGASLSLQMHNHRAEHWVVVKGIACVTKDKDVFELKENESTFIPLKTKHRLQNKQKQMLEIIEIQSGDYLGEDDIFRFEDVYGR